MRKITALGQVADCRRKPSGSWLRQHLHKTILRGETCGNGRVARLRPTLAS